MKTKDLINMINNGEKPIIKFTNNIIFFESADPEMMGKVISFDIHNDDYGNQLVVFKIDMFEFYEYNKNIAIHCWRDSSEEPLTTWMESKYYPKDHIEEVTETVSNNYGDSILYMIEVIEL
jgi:hypothetical protein